MRDFPREGTIFYRQFMSRTAADIRKYTVECYSNTRKVVPFNEVLNIFKGLFVIVFKGVPV